MITISIGSKGVAVQELQRLLHLQVDGIFGKITDEAVRDFQKENGLVVDGIVGEKTWAALKGDTLVKSKRFINEIIVHCSATPEGKDYTVADIKRWHLKRGFGDIGYHYVIYRDGTIHSGRSADKVGAHTIGHNTHSLGVCYIGGVAKDAKTPKDTRTEAQKAALARLLKRLHEMYPKATLHGHREFANKACPSFDVHSAYDYIFTLK